MSLYEYQVSREIAEKYPFRSIIMAAMRGADSENARLLEYAFPDIYDELDVRYYSSGGLLPDEVSISEEEENNE